MAISVASEQRIELLGTVELLHDHLTTSLCQTVFQQTRTTLKGARNPRLISDCFRTMIGARVFYRIQSYLPTMKKQGHNVITALKSAFSGTPLAPDVPG